jgi:hypothetical protein
MADNNNNNHECWRTDGNNVDAKDWLGTRNNAPLIIRTENGGGVPNPGAEAMRITSAADGRRVGIGTATPTQKLTLGSGNCLLRDANVGNDGNLYFGGITNAGQTGMRLFGGLVNGAIPAGFIDVRTTDANDGLRVRVDTSVGGTERMRITAGGNVGIAIANPTQRLQLGAGNLLLPNAQVGTNGNLYFGGTTDTGQLGMRLFGGRVNPGPGEIHAGFIDVKTDNAADGLRIRVDTASGGTERMRVTAAGNVGIGTMTPGARLSVNGDVEVTGDIRLLGADCAENFDVSEAEAAEPGTVMVIDQEGTLKPSEQAYDKRVAGVVSGAEGYKPGIVLDEQKSEADRMPVALIGKVACKVDARHSPIEVGDLLTSSSTSGHAMKADDPLRAFGAVIGKALHSLKGGQDIIPVLIALQ